MDWRSDHSDNERESTGAERELGLDNNINAKPAAYDKLTISNRDEIVAGYIIITTESH